MKPNKIIDVPNSKLYKAIKFKNDYIKKYGMILKFDDIQSLQEIEYIIILYALGCIERLAKDEYMVIYNAKIY